MLTRAIAERLMISETEAEQLKAQLAEVLMDQIPQATSPFGVLACPRADFTRLAFQASQQSRLSRRRL
jgi:hypothetical protein